MDDSLHANNTLNTSLSKCVCNIWHCAECPWLLLWWLAPTQCHSIPLVWYVDYTFLQGWFGGKECSVVLVFFGCLHTQWIVRKARRAYRTNHVQQILKLHGYRSVNNWIVHSIIIAMNPVLATLSEQNNWIMLISTSLELLLSDN